MPKNKRAVRTLFLAVLAIAGLAFGGTPANASPPPNHISQAGTPIAAPATAAYTYDHDICMVFGAPAPGFTLTGWDAKLHSQTTIEYRCRVVTTAYGTLCKDFFQNPQLNNFFWGYNNWYAYGATIRCPYNDWGS